MATTNNNQVFGAQPVVGMRVRLRDGVDMDGYLSLEMGKYYTVCSVDRSHFRLTDGHTETPSPATNHWVRWQDFEVDTVSHIVKNFYGV